MQCSRTYHYEDVRNLERFLNDYRAKGGQVPPKLQAALEVAKLGSNVEEAMNSACLEMLKFTESNQEFCARFVGFPDAASANRGGDVQKVDDYFVCLSSKDRMYLRKGAESVLSIKNQGSFVSVFSQKVIAQVREIAARWVKRKGKEKAQPRRPPYENPAPRLP